MAQMFTNLPVKDLSKSREFFGKLGFEFDPEFTDENAACMIIGTDACVMLLTEEFFKGFVPKDLADTRTHTECILALSAGSRQRVNELVDTALAEGASPAYGPMEDGPGMYGWSFQDLDGHIWEVMYMDRDTVQQS